MKSLPHAVILAAGVGSRLRPLTHDTPKCLMQLRGYSILEHQLRLFARCGVRRVTVITGHGAELVAAAVGDRVALRGYPDYARTNNLCTLAHCGDLLEGDTLIAFSDVLVDPGVLANCARARHAFTLIVDTARVRAGTMRVTLVGDTVSDLGGHIAVGEGHGSFVGIAKVSAAAAPVLRGKLLAAARDPSFRTASYTEALRLLAVEGHPLHYIDAAGGEWIEIDTPEDYRFAQEAQFYLA